MYIASLPVMHCQSAFVPPKCFGFGHSSWCMEALRASVSTVACSPMVRHLVLNSFVEVLVCATWSNVTLLHHGTHLQWETWVTETLGAMSHSSSLACLRNSLRSLEGVSALFVLHASRTSFLSFWQIWEEL